MMRNEMKVAATMIALTVFFSAGCSKKNEENLTTKSNPEHAIAAGMKSTTLKELGYNNVNTSAKITVDYTYQSGYKTSWSRQVSGSFKLGAKGKIGIPFVAEGEVSTEIMIGGATTDGTESSNTKTIKSAYTADVPANSKVIITVLTKKKQSKVSYKVPMAITGQISVNYPSSVDGHYFWYDNADILLKNPKAEEGVAQAVENITTQIIASKPVKIWFNV